MKKIYSTPEIEIVGLNYETSLLAASYDPSVAPETPTIPGEAGDDDLV